jgi:WD40 repeat protein
VRVWDVATGQVDHVLEGHSDSVSSIAFSSGGRKPDSGQPEKTHLFYSVNKSNWVTKDSSRILYLPVDHRPGRIATEGSTLAIGTPNGRVTIITFYSDVKM